LCGIGNHDTRRHLRNTWYHGPRTTKCHRIMSDYPGFCTSFR
jgi:hypothetical protein